MDLRITYDDGTEETIFTNRHWKTSPGALVYNNIYTGEHYDFRKEQPGWNMPGFDDSKWTGTILRSAPSQNVTAQQLRPIRNLETINVKELKKIDDKTYLCDFGRNIAGVVNIAITGEPGTEVRLIYAEKKTADGHADISAFDHHYLGDKNTEPFHTDILYLSGKEDKYMPKFSYKGFRYLEITATKPIQLNEQQLTAHFMHSDVPETGNINTSSDLLNKVWWITNTAYLSNLMGYPTDCPQREKNGWTGDGHFAIETALYNYDAITVYEKWMADHRDEQQPSGMLPDIIPTSGWGYCGISNGLDWTSTIAIIPWNLYLFYGDSKPLHDCYENIKRYVDFIDRLSPTHLTAYGRGDWVPVKTTSDLMLTSSIYFYVDTKILATAAKLFGKQDDHEHYSQLAEQIKTAINNNFLNRETGIYAQGTQTELSTPLQWQIVPEDMIAKVAANLAKKVEETDYHLDVGVLGAKAILNALSENGHVEAAYKIATQDTYPSWGWWVVNGATTAYESWEVEISSSLNHVMFGEIGAWPYKGLAGIFPDPEQPGFKNIQLRPNFVKALTHFEADHQSPYGKIVSKWAWADNKIIYEAVIPANSTATLTLPDNVEGEKVMQLKAGTHKFLLKVKG